MTASKSTVWAAAALNLGATTLVGAFTAIAVTSQWSTAETLGRHTEILNQQTKLMEAQATRLDQLGTEINETNRRLQISQTDIGMHLASAGISVNEDVTMELISDQIVAFPMTTAAKQLLIDKNLEPIAITPAINGYVLDAQSVEIINGAISNSESPDNSNQVLKSPGWLKNER
ncbi:hypothetical protein U0C82_18800 [Fulvimarina sp. 2208YS6-2-32]|uniref:Uncharacterized protein n=1 Tax=Fulvimarina uroteuthidis TaxID=3098149 RepID=A0ABU5I705_9HYPH|nr:hypothetical protein [Fulvimarina sp. 2208YS6-2-32]MDY8111170.1 hypothetical protein [Fulvimarina sp. 2208YS6-2-32]